MAWVRLEQAPARVEVYINVILTTALEDLDIGAMNPNHVTDLSHYRTIFKSIRVNNDDRKIEVFVDLVTLRMEGSVDDFQGADPLALAALHWVATVNHDAVDIKLVLVFGVQRMVPHFLAIINDRGALRRRWILVPTGKPHVMGLN